MKIKFKIYPKYGGKKGYTQSGIIDNEDTLSKLDEAIRDCYNADKKYMRKDLFDFGDDTHCACFYIGKRPHAYRDLEYDEKISSILHYQLTYEYDMGSTWTFSVEFMGLEDEIKPKIKIIIKKGNIQVQNIPKGYDYQIEDWDIRRRDNGWEIK